MNNIQKTEKLFSPSKYLIFSSLFFFICSLFFAPLAFGAIRYPIQDLDNCRNAYECKLYCDLPKNTPVCWAYDKYILSGQVLGETTVTDEEIARKKGIELPINELGNCQNVSECRSYCQQPENHQVCSNFAKKKRIVGAGFREIKSEILNFARKELGCDSKTACQQFCHQPENKEACRIFGEKYNLIKKVEGKSKSFHPEIWAKAKSELGCFDELACKNLCQHPDNKRRCQAFAKRYKLYQDAQTDTQKLEMQRELFKAGKCANEKECREYCQKHPNECPGFSQDSKIGSPSATSNYLGPGGCKTERDCYEYCQAHPQECPSYPKITTGTPSSSFGKLPKVTPSYALEKSPTPFTAE